MNNTRRSDNVKGIDKHHSVDILIITADAVVITQHEEAIIIIHQYAYIGNRTTIYSRGNMDIFQNEINGKFIKILGCNTGLRQIMVIAYHLT